MINADRMRLKSKLRAAERTLVFLGVVAIGYYVIVSAETLLYQAFEDRELDQILHSRTATADPTKQAQGSVARDAATPHADIDEARAAVARPNLIARLEIPRLGVSVVVREGIDAKTLRLAVGHIPGTAWPGATGNVGLAGHRDTFFRRLRHIQAGDEIRLATEEGSFRYRVGKTSIVMPKDVHVLDQTPQPVLTLVTCYPFFYVGSAPQRFIVRADMQ